MWFSVYLWKKCRVTANKWDTPIDIDRFFELSKKLLKDTGVIALTAINPFASYLVNKGVACINTERNFLINDLNKEYFKISKEICSKTYTSTL